MLNSQRLTFYNSISLSRVHFQSTRTCWCVFKICGIALVVVHNAIEKYRSRETLALIFGIYILYIPRSGGGNILSSIFQIRIAQLTMKFSMEIAPLLPIECPRRTKFFSFTLVKFVVFFFKL
uniref:Uncharacterized protein n=1 Tax=Glypta fumiferanae TaxID=389681 RepID=A0A0F6Q764_9HYME|nr:hypothetical protein [Glypta fumiferanae]